MSWEVGFPPNFDPDGDKTSEILGKHINELDRIYAILSQLFDSVAGHTHDGTINNGPIIPTATYSTYSTNATKLATPRNINNVSFDGTTDITIPTVPTGGIIIWSGIVIPSGWLLCGGQAISRTTYATLFSAIGTTFGSGDGSTTFNIPNLKDRFVLGSGGSYNLSVTGGAATHTLTIDEMPSHTHSYTAPPSGYDNMSRDDLRHNFGYNYTATTGSAGGNQPHNNMPPYLALAYIIKA